MGTARPWPWPKEPTPTAIPNSPNWMQRHPTRYNLDADVMRYIHMIYEMLGLDVRCNTYELHPEHDYVPGRIPPTRSWGAIVGYNTQRRSFDTWGPGGRGDPVGAENGTKVVRAIFRDPDPPFIDWLIWRGRLWTPERGWEIWQSDGTGLHYDHPHKTFSPTRMAAIMPMYRDIAPRLEDGLAELDEGWEDDREEEFWADRPDDGKRYIKAEGLWVPVD